MYRCYKRTKKMLNNGKRKLDCGTMQRNWRYPEDEQQQTGISTSEGPDMHQKTSSKKEL